jgi:hypothetical protein
MSLLRLRLEKAHHILFWLCKVQEACVSGREGGNATSFSSYTQYTRHVEKEAIKQNLLSLSLK